MVAPRAIWESVVLAKNATSVSGSATGPLPSCCTSQLGSVRFSNAALLRRREGVVEEKELKAAE